jgi:hypothetical protein
MMKKLRYRPLSVYLKERFGEKVFKITIDAGFGCPTRENGGAGCSFCNQGSLEPKEYGEELGVTAQLDMGAAKIKKRHNADKFIAYFQINTNTFKKIDELRALYKEAVAHPLVVGLAVSTRPDCLSDEVFELLCEIKKDKAVWLELGLQSANDATLKRINRGHTAADFEEAALVARDFGIDVCAHIVMGLPGDEVADMLETVSFVSSLGVWGVKFHQLMVLRDTPLEAEFKEGKVELLGLDEYAEIVVESLELISPDVVVHRLSGDAPKSFVVAPDWGVNKFIIKERIEEFLVKRDTRQGARWRI